MRRLTMLAAGILAGAIILHYFFHLFSSLLINILLILTILLYLAHLTRKYRK